MSTTRALEHAIQHVKNGSTVELTTDDVLSMWGLVRAARLDELERENARLRAALEEIARVDVGGLQGIAEDHRFDADDYDKKEALAKLQAWHDEENVYLMGRIADRRSRAVAALAGSGEK
jgi:hypothetical protein